MNIIFIAGTDTGVGKTVTSGLLARYLLDRGYNVVTQKWAETGSARLSKDIDAHLAFMGKTRKDFRGYIPLMEPYVFRFESSPHLAAKLEGRRISIARIARSLKALSRSFDFVIVEGSGGLFVPFAGKSLLIDIVEKLRLPVLTVAGNKLGAINHTLLSIEALKARKIRNIGIIFNDLGGRVKKEILEDNSVIVSKFTGGMVLGALPREKDPYQLRESFELLGKKILSRMKGRNE